MYVDVAGVEYLSAGDSGLAVALGRPLQGVQRVPVAHQHALAAKVRLHLNQLIALLQITW